MLHTISHPELFTLATQEGTFLRGGDQEWFSDPWRRRAGCGPTTAAMLLAYMAWSIPSLAPMAPRDGRTQEGFLAYMNEVWSYVTPGSRGLDHPEYFALGCRSFALSKGCCLEAELLEIPPLGDPDRPSEASCRAFLTHALECNRPVAFLNFSNGSLDNLDSWHWVPIIALMDSERLLGTVLDGGREHILDLGLWLETAQPGGALVTLSPVDVPLPVDIRPAVAEDLDAIAETYSELFSYEQIHGSSSNWISGVYPTRAGAAASLEAGTLYVLTEGGQVRGSMILNQEQAPDYASIPWTIPAQPEQVMVVHTLCIPPSKARRGWGRAMVAFALETARARGCSVLRLDTAVVNHPAAALYEGMGFHRAGQAHVIHQGLIPEDLLFFEQSTAPLS